VRHRGPVLADTNIILEAHRVGSWRAFASGYGVETVEDCVTETQTGFQRRRPERRIDAGELRASLAAVHPVGTRERAEMALRAHALRRDDAWVLCGPDKASLRFGVRMGFRERLVSLERLLDDAGHRPRSPLRIAYTATWQRRTLAEIVLAERNRGA